MRRLLTTSWLIGRWVLLLIWVPTMDDGCRVRELNSSAGLSVEATVASMH